MIEIVSRKAFIYLLFLAAGVFVLLLLPIKIPYSLDVPGKIVASKEWVVSKGVNGRLMTVLIDHKQGVNKKYSVTQFERGDAVEFNLNPHIVSGTTIAAMDTIGLVYSNEIERRLAELKGQLAMAKASLQLYLSGEKESIIEEAKQQLASRKKQVEEQGKILDRLKALNARELVSKQEYEIALGLSTLYEIDVSIAKAQLQIVQTGAKKEQVEYIQSQIQAFQQEIEILKKRLADFTLISPISGVVCQIFSGDTLLVVKDTTEYAVIMPVKWQQRRYIATRCPVKLLVPDITNVPKAILVKMDKTTHYLNGEQVLIATAIAKDNVSELVPGLRIQCSIDCGRVRPSEYVKRFFKSIFKG
ncbi:MAG: hypothetical protein GTO29_10245 [Candidatus Latescibacteria bacterium]|nr:hypothetical protein [Candidatus Latescibacterota bacterium]NIO56541.1 hypothetical protein [Candidatus Latescibacterota bacterium]